MTTTAETSTADSTPDATDADALSEARRASRRRRRSARSKAKEAEAAAALESGDPEPGAEATNGAAEKEPAPRRRRARKAKASADEPAEANADPDATDPDEAASAPKPRSRRKRARKVSEDVVGAESAGESTAAESPTARSTTAQSTTAQSATDESAASDAVDASGEPPPKRRSRSRRGKARAEVAEATDGASNGAAAEPDSSAEQADTANDTAEAKEVAPPRKPDPARISQHLATFSDRAIQRVTGGNAFLRGRLYARRGHVHDLWTHGSQAKVTVQVKQDTSYEPKLTLTDEEQWVSDCNCPGFRGPTNHCKHVAALMVALRDRERPPKPKQPKKDKQPVNKQEVKAHSPQTVSVGGKRRSRRRRRRGGGEGGVEVLSARDLGLNGQEPRGSLDAWLPPEDQVKAYELDFRMQVRAASIAITPVLSGSRSAVPIADVLAGFNTVPCELRPVLRALARHTPRNSPATAEVRGEDAAEVLSMLRGRRVLLEPASMELRFSEEPLRPRIEMDSANAKAVRIRVVFESGSRKFALSSGHWFEGTPGWHIDTTEGVARPVHEAVTPAWLQRLYRSPALVHPAMDLPRLLTDFVPRVAASLATELPQLEQIADLVDAPPKFRVDLDGDIIKARAKVTVAYGDNELEVPPEGFPSPLEFLPPASPDSTRPRVVRRDIGAEMVAVQTLMNHGFAADEEKVRLQVEGDPAVAFWTGGVTELPKEWKTRIPDDLAKVNVRSTPVSAQMRVSSGVDWLSLDMAFLTEGVAVDHDELRMCLENGRKLVKLQDGSYAPVREEDVSEILERMAEMVAGDMTRLPLSQAGRVQDLMRLVGDHTVSPAAKSLFTKLGDVGEIPLVAKPRNLKVKKFRDYQKRGFSWLAFLHTMAAGGILADDMGLGKTLQTIALLVWAKNKHKRQLNLVVAPTSVVPNWQREIEKFAPSLKVVIWQGQNRERQRDELNDADVMITSYALLRRDEELLQSLGLRYVVLDEAQHIKNPMSATARAAKKLESERRLALTGTPIENRLSEIWSIFDFVSPGLLGTLKTFEERYSRPIDRGDEEAARKLRTIIQPLIMRRTKSEVAPELPEKIEQSIVVPLAEAQSKLYKQMLKQVRDSLMSEVEKKGVSKSQIQILAALTRMRQVACDPRLTSLQGEWSDETSGKLQALREIVEEAVAGGHRILIFSQFVTMLGLIRDLLDERGVTYEYLDGSTKDRQARVDRFNEDDKIDAFLISLKAGGTGLNLTGADTVIHFDPWWNPAVEDQATDRAHRIGQTRVVNVYKLIARDTVEEKILQLSAKKRDLVSNVLTTESTPLKGLTRADIDDLFS
ncbi:MAG: SNF2-related protein [Sandaracinaceae bacterium]